MTTRFLLLATLVTGCASSNYKGLSRDTTAAAELSVRPHYEKVPVVRRTNFTAADGTTAGSAETVVGYRDVLTGFFHASGDTAIDEQDFYHLAGKTGEADAIAAARRKGLLMNRVGLAMLVAGTAATFVVPIALGDRTTAKYSVGQWFVTFPIGLALTAFGKRRVERNDNYSAAHAFGAIDRDAPGWAGSR